MLKFDPSDTCYFLVTNLDLDWKKNHATKYHIINAADGGFDVRFAHGQIMDATIG
jgi:hypothetical protein